mgnify:CR=1 FL=1
MSILEETSVITNLKKRIAEIASKNTIGHLPSSYSCLDILYVLYSKIMNINPANKNSIKRDKVIISKEHCKMAQLAILEHLGLIDKSVVDEWQLNGGIVGHDMFKEVDTTGGKLAALDCAYGSLGQGIGLGTGLAMANPENNVYVIVGDGELQEGSCWEALMYIGHNNIKNIITIIDRNNIQGGDYTKNIIDTSSNCVEQISSFGFEVFEVDGHNHEAMEEVFKLETDKPKAVVANTIKGKEFDYVRQGKGFLYFHSTPWEKEDFKIGMEVLENE